MWSLTRIVAGLTLAAMTCGCNRVAATAQASGAAPAGAAGGGRGNQAASPPAVDPNALKALEKMTAYLRTVSAFQLVADTTRDEVLDDGQRIQYGGHLDMLAQRPNRLRVEVTNDRQQRFFFFDGKSFTLWAPRMEYMEYYVTVPAPSTIGDLIEGLQDKYGIELPMVDLFRWGATEHGPADVQAATDVGPAQVGGVSCEHFAFRQSDVDWQVWIQLGAYPLPRKLVITTMSDPARPQYSSTMTWNLAPSYNDAAFTFEPPPAAKKITIQELSGRGGEPRK